MVNAFDRPQASIDLTIVSLSVLAFNYGFHCFDGGPKSRENEGVLCGYLLVVPSRLKLVTKTGGITNYSDR